MTNPQTCPLARLASNEPRTMDVSFVPGNIIRQSDAQAVVNSANANLRFGSGVVRAIHGAAEQRLEDFCAPLAPLALGEALIAPSFDLPKNQEGQLLKPATGKLCHRCPKQEQLSVIGQYWIG